MATHVDRRKWLVYGLGFFVIVVLLITLLFLIFSEKKLPDNAVVMDEDVINGEMQNEEMVKKINELIEREPVLAELPLVVEYYSEDYSEYTKYIISYELDDSERGFYLIVKDYTGAGMVPALGKLTEMGMDTIGLELKYEDLTGDALNFRADVL
ncbi:hypothetical protein IJI18_02670 [Candidatus Saccharibacteria bacterium]|nr:hypothetical protein [Candidatus Saccharibacteria bacterium]